MPDDSRTLVELLQKRAGTHPGRGYVFLPEGELDDPLRMTYAELDRRARSLALHLREAGAAGERVLLLFPPGLDFIAAFFGCLYAGAVAVPAYPPRRRRTDPRLAAIAADCTPRVVLTLSPILARAAALSEAAPQLATARWIALDEMNELSGLTGEAGPLDLPAASAPAFLQYTSGSTGTPKGVVVTHGNLIHNEEMIGRAFGQSEDSVVVGWLPLYHDMGLIGNVLQPLWAGGECVLMPPVAFLQKPLRWLAAIGRYRATTSGGPNFAYDLCVRKITPEQRRELDLSSWSVAYNGAEPVRAETLERFAEAFAPAGFRREAFYPCYGLAEATLFVAGGEAGSGARVGGFAAGSLERQEAVPATPGEGERSLVGCGTAWMGQRVAIVDPATGTELSTGRVGEIWVAGPSVAAGYWGKPEESERLFGAALAGGEGPFLRTGDLGFVHGGELFVAGRLKDLIILRGRNHYPQDIERTAEAGSPVLRQGCGAAFSVEEEGEERLVVVYEIDRRAEADAALEAVRRAVAEEHEVQVHEVVLVRTGTVPKTSSGKIRRQACRSSYLEDGLEVIARSGVDRSALDSAASSVAAPERAGLLALPVEERSAVLLPWLRGEVARLVRVAPGTVDPERPLTALGLDSLAAVELQHEAESVLGVPVSLPELLEGTTLAELAGAVAERLGGEPRRWTPSASPAERVHPLSDGQRGLWFLHRLAPEGGAYNLVSVARTADLDPEALRRALEALCARHPALRSAFDETGDGPIQRVAEPADLALDFALEDASALDEKSWQRRLDGEAWRSFDLTRPPVRVRVWERAAGEWVVLLAVHHLVADFWSLALMLEELGTLYAAESGGAPARLAEPAASYGDFVSWQRERLSGTEGDRLWGYWRERLSGGLPILDLPTDRPRPPVQSFRGASRALVLPAELAGGLELLGRERGATLFMTLTAAFHALLHRASGQETILVGSPTAGREVPELAGVVGYFTNPVVLRADFGEDLRFGDLLEAVRRDALGALAHAAFPFPLLIERLQPERDASRNPLFQAMLVLQKAHKAEAQGLASFTLGEAGTPVRLGPLALTPVPLAERRSPFDLLLMLATVDGGGLAASLQYSADLFDPATAARLLGHFEMLLAGVVAAPDLTVEEIGLLTPAEREQVLVRWNETALDVPRDLTLIDLVAAQAERTPEAPALVCGTEALTYNELMERVDGLGRHLRALGVGPEVRVGVCLDRGTDLVVSLLAVLRAGGAYVPLDPAYPAERLRFMLEDAAASVVLTREGIAEGIGPRTLSSTQPLPGNLAYLIYTSGSTGRPKAVAIEHRSAVALVGWAREVFAPADLACVLFATSVCFDLSVFELFVPLSLGGTVVLAADALALPSLPAAEQVTLINTVPSALDQLVAGPLPKALRVVNLAGEPLPGDLVRRIHARRPEVRVYNLYGPSEDTTYSTGALIPVGERSPAIGRPLANTRVYLLDRRGGPVPVGVPGELWIGGEGLARGYLGRPELTAERFLPDALSGRAGERLYRTGDLARRRADGELEFLGRIDHQVKIHGFRIELGEIETALRAHPAVRECVVVAREQRGAGRRLVAYVAGDLPPAGATGELQRFLRERLPVYMVPPVIALLDPLPRTPNGKVDRKALPDPEAGRPELASAYTAPRDGREERLAAIWAVALGVGRVGIHDNFFELGGDSILSLQVVARAREAGLCLTPQQMFQHQTVAELAAVAVAATAGAAQTEVTGPAPLTPIQRWFFGLAPEEPWHFNQAIRVHARRALDPRTLEGALEILLRHHDALRLRFGQAETGAWRQENASWSPSSPLVVVDLGALPAEAREGARSAAEAVFQTGFDLARGPLFRAALFIAGDAPQHLLLTAHHLVIDGVSWRVLLEDLQTAYARLGRGETPELPVKTTSFREWAERLEAFVAAGEAEADLAAWGAIVSRTAPALPAELVPVEGAEKTAGRAGEARRITVSLAAASTRALLLDLPRTLGVDVRDALLTALVEAFGRRTGERVLRVDLEGHGREPIAPEVDLSRTVGWLTALYPVVLDLAAADGAEESMRAIRAQLAEVPGRGLTWGLLGQLQSGAEVVFNYLGRLDGVFPAASPFASAAIADVPVQGPRNRRAHALVVDAWVVDGELTMRWEHAAGERGDAVVRDLTESCLDALSGLLTACGAASGHPGERTVTFHGPEPAGVAELLAAHPELEDVYPVSPLQAGILMHALASPGTGAYIQQLSCALAGDLDEAAFLRAWQRLVDRHTILRTHFLGRGLDEPLQAVESVARLPVEREDWSTLPGDVRARRLDTWLEEDRARGFDLGRAPLLRLLLARTGPACWHLVFTYHHLLLDGWGLVLLLEELFAGYEALRQGLVPEIPAPAPFREHIDWLRSQDPAPAEAFWRQTVADFSGTTPLAADRPVPPHDEPLQHGEVRLRLSAEATAALAAAARRHQLTQGTLVQAAWALLLSRLSSEQDLVFGAVTSGRSADLPAMERRIGLFINTLPMRLRVRPEEGLLPWLREVQARAAESLHHEHTPLVEVQAWSGVPRGQRLFDSILAFENYPIDETLRERVGGLAVSDVRFVERIDYPTAVIVAPGERLSLQMIYDRRMFHAPTMERRLEHLRRLLEGMAAGMADPAFRVAGLPWLSEAERRQILFEWNDTRGPMASDGKLMHQLFEERAALDPEAVAVVAPGETLTYGELDRRANQLARRLRRLGVHRGSLVAIHLGRSAAMVVAVLGVLKAGGTYVPVEVTLPPARVRWIAGFLGLRWVVTEAARLDTLREALGELPAQLHLVADLLAEHPEVSGAPLAPVSEPDDLAYIIFTSGSTGTPKGVVVQHRPVINLIEWVNETFGVGPADRVLFVTALSFDLSVYDIFGLLAAGGSIHIAAERDVREPERLVRLLAEEPVTFWDSAPAALQQLVAALPAEPVMESKLRLAFLSGDWIPLGIKDDVTAAFPHVRFVGLGGATEATIWSNFHRIETVDPQWRSIPYGRPIRNARYHVLDAALEPVAVGVAGDLYIGGPVLAWGYAGEPALTAGKFVPDPFSAEPGAVLYRTGDRARYFADGKLEFLGRLDHQVKIRGFRIELGEIETVLGEHPAVREALVLVREDEPGDRRLVAYVVPASAVEGLEVRELRGWVTDRLPSYMVPAAFVVLGAMPVTANGKLDRKALPAPESVAVEADGAEEERAVTPVEELVAAQWAQVLRLPNGVAVGRDESFFEMGGQSLVATRLVARLREVLGIELSLQDLFEAPTVAGLAERVEAALRGGHGPVAAIERIPRRGALPLSPGQQRLWFLDRLEPGSASYNIPAAVRLRGDLDVAALAGAMRTVVARHEALRTTFRAVEDSAVAVIAPALDLPVPCVDLAGLPAEPRAAEARRLAAEEAGRPFDLTAGPLIRMTLVRVADREHQALVTMHHIVSDGASVEVLLRELAMLYPAFMDGHLPVGLPELPIQYVDFAAWQRAHLSEVADHRLAWWRERLLDAPPLLELPTDRPRPAVQSFRGALRSADLPPALAAGVRELALREGATPFMVLLAGFEALLWHYSGQDDLLVGTPAANRQRAEVEPLIGFFVNTLVLRAEVPRAGGFGELLRHVRAAALGAWAHQDLPFERIVEELRPERSLGHHPLFQVMFTLETDPERLLEIPGLTLGLLPAGAVASKFDLALSLFETAGGLRAAADYRTDLFDGSTIERLLGHFERLLAAAVADPERPLGLLDLLSSEERRQLLVWSEGPAVTATETAPRLFEESADRAPHALALVCAEGEISYEELEARSNRLARFLRRLGVGAETRVGLAVGRNIHLPVSILGVFKAGGAYVPLDPGNPPARLRFVAEDAGLSLLLTEERLLDRLPELPGVRIVCLDRDGEAISSASPERLEQGPEPGDLAYIIYTSGSTGRPKGVPVEHASLAGLLAACRAELGWSLQDRMPCIAPYSFDIFLFELLNPLAAGGTIVLLETRPALDLRDLLAALEGSTRLHAVPALMRQVMDAAAEAPADRFAALRTLFVGGDRVPPELLADMARVVPQAETRVLYGPTEATVICASHRAGSSTIPGERAWIGHPLPGAALRLCNSDGALVPLGVPGEIRIGGAGVARGYWNREELTADRFVTEDGRRWYRSGDRACRLADGSLEFLGRVDQQVKIRGFRIDPGEVESVLCEHPRVREAAVLALSDGAGDRRLVAWAVPAEDAGEADLPEVLRAWMGERLPEYMIPSALVLLPMLPLTAHGKLDRAALPVPEAAGAARRAPWVAPRTLAEREMAAIWSEVLGVPAVGAGDGFFELGGHSLLATRVVSRVRARLGVDLPLRALFEAPTLEAFAARAAAARAEAAEPIERAPRDGALPASFAQRRLWYLDQVEPGDPTYNMPLPVRLSGRLDVQALRAALAAVVARHESLRTRFAESADGPVQEILPAGSPVALPITDLSALPAALRDTVAAGLAIEEAAQPFDLGRGPLHRFALLRLGSEEHVLFATLHHIVGDGWSMGVLVREIAQLLAQGPAAELPELPVQYADWAVWQRRPEAVAAVDTQLAWWRERLAGAPMAELPVDRARRAAGRRPGGFVGLDLPDAVADGLRRLASGTGATLYMTALAGYAALLARSTGQEDLVLGTPLANRQRPEVEGVIGFFVNTLPLRLGLAGDPTAAELVERVRGEVLALQAHQDVPFDRLVQELCPGRRAGEQPFFRTVFTLERTPLEDLGLSGLSLAPFPVHNGTAKFDLTLTVVETGRRLTAWLEYAADAVDRTRAQRLLSQLATLLASAVEDPARPLSRLVVLGEAERHQIACEWNDTDTAYPADLAVHQVFAAQVAKTPDAVAVVCDGDGLTYRELDLLSSHLAWRLVDRGVGPEVRVGIMAERSLDLLVGLLAILKAGGAYVPLDPSYPASRLEMIADDAGLSLVLAQPKLAADVPGGQPVVFLETGDVDDLAEIAAPESGAGPDDLVYVLYTSGSTGRPKGVSVPHRGVVRLVRETNYIHLGPGEVLLHMAPLAFDASTLEIWGALLTGGCVAVMPPGNPTLAELAWEIERCGVTTLWLTAGLFHLAVDEHPEALAGLRQLLAGGDALSAPHVRRALEVLPPGARLINGYGPTESTTFTCCHPMSDPAEVGGSVPLGRPISNTRVVLLDRASNLVPIGVPGELCIGGDGLARCYLDRPDLTAERFVPHPAPRVPGELVYRTGDLARLLPDGRVEFLGRLDNQVKIRGFRVEPGEVESVLAGHRSVRDAVVMVRTDDAGDRRLAAYLVLSDPGDLAALRSFAGRRLPQHMIPTEWTVLDRLPLTPNGKVDRRALPEPEAAVAEETRAALPASASPVREILAGFWAEVLNVERVGADDDFYELGGHSLLATQVVARVRSAFGVEIPLRTLLEASNLEDFAQAVEEEIARGRRASELPPIAPVSRAGGVPLSLAQRRLWFLDQVEPGNPAYNIPAALRIRGALDPAAIAASLTEIVRRHETLRSSFPAAIGLPVQQIAPPAPVRLPLVDLSALPAAGREALASELLDAENRRSFDLLRGPLLRSLLLRLAPEEHLAVFTVHHIVADGWSMEILVRELGALYAAYAAGQPSPLAELPFQYPDFAAWQQRWLEEEIRRHQLPYWQARLEGAPATLDLPIARSRATSARFRSGLGTAVLPADLCAELRTLARRQGSTLFMVLLAGWKALLHLASGSTDLLIGTPIANRHRREIEDLIGFFVNTLVLRTDLSGNPGFLELLGRVRDITLEAHAHQDLSFDRLVEEIDPPRVPGRNPLFQVMFDMLTFRGAAAGLEGLHVEVLPLVEQSAKFDMTLYVAEAPESIGLRLAYNADLFAAAAIDALLADYRALLQQAVRDPQTPLSALLRPHEDEADLLAAFNDDFDDLQEM